MSHYIFGEYISKNVNQDMMKKNANNLGFNLWLNSDLEEIDWFQDIVQMLDTHSKLKNSIKFYLTSKDQLYVSDDIIFPYSHYSYKELFPNETREAFKKLVNINLQKLFVFLDEFISEFGIEGIRIFISGGYDDDFEEIKCSLATMIKTLEEKVNESFTMDSRIYEILI